MEKLMTSEEVAEIFHVDPVTVRRIVNKGELAGYRIASDYRFAPSDVEAYLQRQRIGQPIKNEVEGTFVLDQLSQWIVKVLKVKNVTPAEVVDRFDRFTPQARRILTQAHEEAQRFQHSFIGTEHLLLGLVHEDTSHGTQILRNMNIELSKVNKAVEWIVSREGHQTHEGQSSAGIMPLTGRAKKVIELSVDEARRLNRQMVDTEHLLVGLVREGEGIAAGVLKSLGVTLEGLRTQLYLQSEENKADMIPEVPPEASELLTEGEQGIVCSRCQAASPRYFRFCFNCGQRFDG